MKHDKKLALGFTIIGAICIIIVISSLVFFKMSEEIIWFWDLELGIIVLAITGAILLQNRHPDERAMRIFNDASRNSWTFFLIALPVMTTLLSHLMVWDELMTAKWLYLVWNIAFGVFGGTIALKYWK